MSPPARLRPPACEVCDQTTALIICQPCQAVWYCSPDHEDSDREKHRHACKVVASTRADYKVEERILRDESSTDGRASCFETDAGRFGRIREARAYLAARRKHADQLLHFFGSTDGEDAVTARSDVLELALSELLDITRLSRTDEVEARASIPAIYLALGRDQEAYDFIKWITVAYNTWDPDDWDDLDRPFLDLRGEDVLEGNLDVWLRRCDEMLTFIVAVILIKLRVVMCLLDIQKARRSLARALPNEIVDIICWHLAGPVLSCRPDILTKGVKQTMYLIFELKHQALELYVAVTECSNTPFWDLMLDSDSEAVKRNKKRQLAPQSGDELDLMARCNFTPWLMTPAALEAVREWRAWILRGGLEWLREMP